MRIINLATVLFAAILAVVIGYRIDSQTLAILAGVTVGFVIAAISVGLFAFFIVRQNRQPDRPFQSDMDSQQPYHIQYPLPKAKQLSFTAPQYDDTVTFTVKHPQRKWVAVDEVTR